MQIKQNDKMKEKIEFIYQNNGNDSETKEQREAMEENWRQVQERCGRIWLAVKEQVLL